MDANSFDLTFAIANARRAAGNEEAKFVAPTGFAKSDWSCDNRQSRSWLNKIAALWNYWRDEREIRRAIRELAKLDDHTLRDIGIRGRSEIEFTVRFCRRC